MKIPFLVLLLHLLPACARSQVAGLYQQYDGGLCNASVLLLADGYYNMEGGCEASSRFSFGKWRQHGDTIRLYPVVRKDFKVLKKVVITKSADSDIVATVFDRNGKNITGHIMVAQSLGRQGTFALPADSNNLIRRYAKVIGSVLTLRPFRDIFDQEIAIPCENGHRYAFTLNITDDWIFQAGSRWFDSAPDYLLVTREGLLSARVETPGPDGAVRTLYRRAQY